MLPFPRQTKCGDCGAPVRLKKNRWDELSDDDGTVHGYLQHRRCKCGSNVVAAIGDDTVFAFLKETCEGAKVDYSPPGYH